MSHEERDHAALGGSKADIWMNCQGSYFLTKDDPPIPATPSMLLGTAKHEAAEILITDYLEHKVKGTDPNKRAHLIKKKDIIAAAKECVEFIWTEIFEEYVTGKAWGLEDRICIDEKLEMYGYADLWAIKIGERAKKVGVIVDFKFGHYEVDIDKNPQPAFYLVALRKEIQKLGKDIDEGVAYIFQPNDAIPRESWIKKVTYSAKQLDNWEAKFYKAAEQIFVKKEAKFKVGDWCQWCSGKARCKARFEALEKKSELSLVNIKKTKLPAVETLTDDQILKIVQHKKDIEDFLKACYVHAFNKAATVKFPGMKIVEGRGRRSWIDDEEGIITAISEAGVECLETKLLALTAVEKELAKKLGKKEAEAFLSPYLKKSAPKLLVDIDDERPEVKNTSELLTAIED